MTIFNVLRSKNHELNEETKTKQPHISDLTFTLQLFVAHLKMG